MEASMIDNQYTTLELRVHRKVEMPDNSSILDLVQEWGMDSAAQESIWVITYDSGRNLRTVTEVAKGSYRDVMVSIPSVMAAIHRSGADRFILVHNHPSGNTSPTLVDMDMTRKIMAAANTNGLYFEDHLIVSPGGDYTSLVDQKLLIPDPTLAVKAEQGAVRAVRPKHVRFLLHCGN